MAEPTKAELAGDIRRRMDALEREFDSFRQLAVYRLNFQDTQLADRVRADEQLLQRLTDALTKLAAAEERLRALEKTADRNWQGWLALIGAGVAIVVAVLRK